MHRRVLCVPLLCLVFGCAPARAQSDLTNPALATMKKATAYFTSKVACHGGYLWWYTADLKQRAGEGKATPSQIWIQPPGTPSVGLAYVRAYEATGDQQFLDAAVAAARALVWGQLESGGWDYRIDFSPKGDKRWAYRHLKLDDLKGRRNISTLDDNNTFSHNRCYGGKYGVSLWGTDESNRETGWDISGNLFSEQYDGAVILSYQQKSRTESNHICHTGSLGTEWKGIYVTGSQDQVIANNAVSFAADRQSVGIGLSSTSQVKIYYNSVFVSGETVESRSLNIQQGGSDITLRNNILVNTSGGVVVYVPEVSSLNSDHNDFYSNSDRFIYTDRWVTDLADWRSAYGKDQHSFSVDPLFFSADSLYTTVPHLNGTATPVEVTTDITGATRDATHPDMGVYEFDALYTLGEDTVICNNTVITLDAGAGYDSYLWNTGATTQTIETSASVNTETWYKVTVAIGGTAYSDSVKVTSAGPVVHLGNDTAICQGSTLTLDAGAGEGYTYLWSDNSTGQTLDVTTAGTYAVTVEDTLHCQATDDIYVNILATQEVHLSFDGFNLMADNYNAVLYVWYHEGEIVDSTTSYTYIPQTSGNYFTEVTQENGCVVISDTLHVEITGIGRVNDPGLNIYPNPGRGHFTISFTNPVRLKEVKVFNTLGSLVYVYNPETLRDQVEIDLSDQPEGIYLIQMRTGDNQLFTRRIIIKR